MQDSGKPVAIMLRAVGIHVCNTARSPITGRHRRDGSRETRRRDERGLIDVPVGYERMSLGEPWDQTADITGLLVAVTNGEETARTRLIEAVYDYCGGWLVATCAESVRTIHCRGVRTDTGRHRSAVVSGTPPAHRLAVARKPLGAML